ncbi:dephospho-CoA kinase [Paenibacillus sp. DS2015]|uniref:adenylate kinase n=1 Tax=Paenibacillus sp. DS2015 TaxID=3373917 RepID=UPI003D25E30C
MKISETCDYCGKFASSPYSFNHENVWYSGHKRCMGAPMIRKLTQVTVLTTLPNIALTGLMRSGKDAVAAYLTQNYGYTRFAFGDELKRYAHELFGEPNGKPRELYQWFGQTMRERDPDIWTRKCFDNIEDSRRIMGHYGVSERAVISDLRQPNELTRCCTESYVIIRVTAPESVRIDRAIKSSDTFNLRDLTHDTEAHVEGFAVDYEINNSKTLVELYAQVDAIMAELGGGIHD